MKTGRFEKPQTIAVDNSCALVDAKRAGESLPPLTVAECETLDPSNGDVYVADAGTNHLVIDKYSATEKYLGQLTEANGDSFKTPPHEFGGVAVDQHSGVALVDNISSLRVFDSGGTERERLGKGRLTQGGGVAANAAAGFIYAADAAGGDVAVFAPEPPGAPSVEAESVANVTALSAELEAEINPRSEAVNPRSEAGEAASEYHFQYGPCATLDEASCKGSPYEEAPGSARKAGAKRGPPQCETKRAPRLSACARAA